MLGPLDEPDVGVGLDQRDPPLDDVAVVGGPVGRDLGDRRRAVPLEPRRLGLAGRDLAGEDDLERALAERDRRRRLAEDREIVGDQAVRAEHLPIELLLQRDHRADQLGVARLTLGEPSDRQRDVPSSAVEQRGALVAQCVEWPAPMRWDAARAAGAL